MRVCAETVVGGRRATPRRDSEALKRPPISDRLGHGSYRGKKPARTWDSCVKTGPTSGPRHKEADMTAYRTIDVNGTEVFYREAGEQQAPTLLLLHGFPSSSAQYERLM